MQAGDQVERLRDALSAEERAGQREGDVEVEDHGRPSGDRRGQLCRDVVLTNAREQHGRGAEHVRRRRGGRYLVELNGDVRDVGEGGGEAVFADDDRGAVRPGRTGLDVDEIGHGPQETA